MLFLCYEILNNFDEIIHSNIIEIKLKKSNEKMKIIDEKFIQSNSFHNLFQLDEPKVLNHDLLSQDIFLLFAFIDCDWKYDFF